MSLGDGMNSSQKAPTAPPARVMSVSAKRPRERAADGESLLSHDPAPGGPTRGGAKLGGEGFAASAPRVHSPLGLPLPGGTRGSSGLYSFSSASMYEASSFNPLNTVRGLPPAFRKASTMTRRRAASCGYGSSPRRACAKWM